MYAVIGVANLDGSRPDESMAIAKNILANVSSTPGFVSGTFARSDDKTAGRSMMVFETEEAARAVAERAPGMLPADGPTQLVSLDVFEVVDHK